MAAKKSVNIFVIMPFVEANKRNRDDLEYFYNNHIKQPIESYSGFSNIYTVDRSGDIFDIKGDIIRKLNDAEIVICDLSGITPNPNVMYELGIRFGVSDKPVILIREYNDENKKVFDVSSYHTESYVLDRLRDLENYIIRKIKMFESGFDKYVSPVKSAVGEEDINLIVRNVVKKLPYLKRHNAEGDIFEQIMAIIEDTKAGEISFSVEEYYDRIIQEIEAIESPSEVIGLATLSSIFWRNDIDQKNYLEKNIAAIERGARIRRLFVISKLEKVRMAHLLQEQLAAGIIVKSIEPSLLGSSENVKDMVIFRDSDLENSRVYIANQVMTNRAQLRDGRMIIESKRKYRLYEQYEELWSMAKEESLRTILHESEKEEKYEPGIDMQEYILNDPVYTCEEAASAKSILLKHELKTIIVSIKRGMVAVHVRGDQKIDFRKVKKELNAKDTPFTSEQVLKTIGLRLGTVCAVKDPVWSMPHLIDKRVLEMSWVSTNNGSLRGYYKFDPKVLRGATNVTVGDFSVNGE